ncbi:MLO-like protein 5 [Morella rubra]|uniref:MLO-like protein n=1 Tax=Morella rubra TaxID=262757 RepID=A0A6A1WMD2_9ROSI|nr:MLO-like protein 5 [Morella rubra]
MAGGEHTSTHARELDQTPTWAVSVVCAVIVLISIILEKVLHRVGEWFHERKKKALFEALEKIKGELMVLGFISLLLTFGQSYISRMCIPLKFADTMLPCPLRNGGDHQEPQHEPEMGEREHHRRLLRYERRYLAAHEGEGPVCKPIRGWKEWERDSVNESEFMNGSRILLSSMAKTPTRNISSFRSLCKVFFISVLSFMSAFYWCQYSRPCYSHYQIEKEENNQPINLLTFPSAWNHLTFSSNPPPKLLKIALFVKKWPHRSHAGGLERHALTLHYALAKRGHETHIFTDTASESSLPVVPERNLYFHLSNASARVVWTKFQFGSNFKLKTQLEGPSMWSTLKMFRKMQRFGKPVLFLLLGMVLGLQDTEILGKMLRVLGSLDQTQLNMFYNAIDIFVNPTLRAQGLDITLLEASLSSKPLMATRLASVIVSSEIGYTFSPTVTSLKDALYRAWIDGR